MYFFLGILGAEMKTMSCYEHNQLALRFCSKLALLVVVGGKKIKESNAVAIHCNFTV
jgi:hypothetical protein